MDSDRRSPRSAGMTAVYDLPRQETFAMSNTPTRQELEFLRSIDTPTVCNLIEIAAPERRGSGYTVKHLHCPFPELPPMVGFAKTVTIKAKDAIAAGEAASMQPRPDYLAYITPSPA